MKFISIGGVCHTTMGLRNNNLYKEAYPFDYIRSTFKGVIDCIENNFKNFFPKKIEVDIIENYEYSGKSCRGKYNGFYHHDLTNPIVINDFNRRIKRFNNLLKDAKTEIIFIRTIVTHDYNDEINLTESFINSINKKFPSLHYLLIFIIPGQDKTMFYKKVKENVFIFTLNDKSENISNIGRESKPIYDFLKMNNLFNNVSEDNMINIKNGYNRFVEVHGYPFTRDDN
jgi:hypothetical protein